ncbi:molybdenum cofactor guanylyltransferase MobA [Henriciella aquimarina]|uniref:molybdenum cofactor guanylyltransferase MobA n=1 Tax=Henriciella aquimarina TaxID=545261 RepID=UPI000A0585A5|nr:molybdenum cofactor guanylyltransferase MobA [Henriciella aquimarina]
MAGKHKCVILAGGTSRRFGAQDKALAKLGGRALIAHVIERISEDGTDLAVNTSDKGGYANFGLPLLADIVPGRLGPLAGVLTAMRWAGEQGAETVFTLPADMPFLPANLLATLDAAEAPVVMAESGGQTHHLCARWTCSLADDLEHALLEEGVRAVWAYAQRHAAVTAEFSRRDGVDPFFNVNSIADLADARSFLDRLQE